MIRGTSLDLRAVERSDLDRIAAWFDDPALMRAWGFGVAAVSRNFVAAQIEEWLASEQLWEHPVAFVVETLDHDPCGLVVVSQINTRDRSLELSLFLEERARGQGLGTDLLESIVDAAFEEWNYHRITIISEAHNVEAHAFFARNGFELEGRMRQARYLDGGWHDLLIFGRIRTADGDDR